MKKIIGIFIAMVFVFMVGSMAFAAGDPIDKESYEVNAMVCDWAYRQNRYDEYNWKLDYGIYRAMGTLSNEQFKDLTGKEFTMENLENLYLNSLDYGFDYGVYYCKVRLVGFIEGYNVYIMDMNARNELGTEDGINYYRVSILFMVSK